MKVLLCIIALFLITACQPAIEDQTVFTKEGCESLKGTWTPTHNDKSYCKIDNQELCESTDGIWKKDGLMSNFICIHIYPDADEPCSKLKDCMGGCLEINDMQKCKENTSPFGCYTFVGDEYGICMD